MLTQDPIGLAGGVNLYEYAGSNPVSFDDPYGLCKRWLSEKDDGKGDCDYDGNGTQSRSEIAAHKVAHASGKGQRLYWNALGVLNTALELPGVADAVALAASTRGGGRTAGGRPLSASGRPLGPSGKPMIHQPRFSTRKAAKDAAHNAGEGPPIHHPSPTRGEPHYHPTDSRGRKLNDGTHYNYPR